MFLVTPPDYICSYAYCYDYVVYSTAELIAVFHYAQTNRSNARPEYTPILSGTHLCILM